MIIKDKVLNYWNKRSEKYTNSIEGVLDKSLVIDMNMYLDNWMYKQVQKLLENDRRINILDIGCGYGRISKKIINDYPKARIRGLDISKNFVKIYNSNLNPKAKAYKGFAEKLPFKDSSFDIVLIVTTLMYVISKQKQKKVISEISRVLKRGGKVLLIEPTWVSSIYLILGKLLRFVGKKRSNEINSTIFSNKKIQTLFLNNNIYRVNTSGIPIFSLLLPLLYLLSKINIKLLKYTLVLISRIDILFSKMIFLSIFISYTGVNLKDDKIYH